MRSAEGSPSLIAADAGAPLQLKLTAILFKKSGISLARVLLATDCTGRKQESFAGLLPCEGSSVQVESFHDPILAAGGDPAHGGDLSRLLPQFKHQLLAVHLDHGPVRSFAQRLTRQLDRQGLAHDVGAMFLDGLTQFR